MNGGVRCFSVDFSWSTSSLHGSEGRTNGLITAVDVTSRDRRALTAFTYNAPQGTASKLVLFTVKYLPRFGVTAISLRLLLAQRVLLVYSMWSTAVTSKPSPVQTSRHYYLLSPVTCTNSCHQTGYRRG